MKTKQQTIMLVDDDRLILSSLSPGLKKAGFNVISANNGKEALDFCKEKTPDLMVLDMRMPEMDGIAVARSLSELKQIPFIFLTAYGDDELIEQAADLGSLGYLIKPVDPQQLLAVIKTALKRNADKRHLVEREEQLTHALEGNRAINTAVGILIERDHMSEKAAFEKLRKHARSRQCKLSEVARELVAASEILNCISE